MAFTDGTLPTDVSGYPVGSVYVPSTGPMALQGAKAGNDGSKDYGAAVVNATLQTGTNTIGNVGLVSPYPSGATPLNATSGDVAAATAAATLTAAASKTTYITGFTFTSTGSTSAATVDITVTDGTWTVTFVYVSVAGATSANTQLSITFPYPLAASAANTTIVASCPTLGTGNLHACMNAYGFRV